MLNKIKQIITNALILVQYSNAIRDIKHDNEVLLVQLEAAHSTIARLEDSLTLLKEQFVALAEFADAMMIFDAVEPSDDDGWFEVTDED